MPRKLKEPGKTSILFWIFRGRFATVEPVPIKKESIIEMQNANVPRPSIG
jgi:hypothetical protein